MKELTLVADKYITDKGSLYNEAHRYTEFYDQFFQKFKCSHPTILEIGIASGGSLRAYRDYYHNKCGIIGLEYNPELLFNEDCIHTFQIDQGSRDMLKDFRNRAIELNDMCDIIIDDGSHENEHQQLSLYYMKDLLRSGGIYIIEDLHTFSWEDDITYSTLYGLLFGKNLKYLSAQENQEIFNSIANITYWDNFIKGNKDEYQTSMTCVITFKS